MYLRFFFTFGDTYFSCLYDTLYFKVISGDSFGNLYIWSDCLGCAQNSKQDMTYVTSLGSSIKSIYLLGKRIICYTSKCACNKYY